MTTAPSAGGLKLGLLPPVEDKRDLLFARYRIPSKLPTPPAQFGRETLVQKWGILGNEKFGCCVFSGAAHEVMLWNAECDTVVPFRDKDVLADYSALTGFNPRRPASDQGTDMRQAMMYRLKTGVVDADGKRHKLGGFVALEPGNLTQLWQATYIFGAVALGFKLTQTAMDQFEAGKPWDVGKKSRVVGGHYVPAVARRGGNGLVVSWGRLQAFTPAFYQTYCDQAFAMLSEERLSQGKTHEGFDLEALRADLKAL